MIDHAKAIQTLRNRAYSIDESFRKLGLFFAVLSCIALIIAIAGGLYKRETDRAIHDKAIADCASGKAVILGDAIVYCNVVELIKN